MEKTKLKVEDIVVEKLNEISKFKIKDFKSTVCKELDDFLKENALDEHNKDFSKTYLFFHNGKIIAYVTLLNDKQTFKGDGYSESLKKFCKKTTNGYSSVPALKIGRLCVVDEYNSQLESSKYFGLGTIIFAVILNYANELKEKVGCRVITTHAKKATGAYNWYLKLGFNYSYCDSKTKEQLAKENINAIPMFYDIQRVIK